VRPSFIPTRPPLPPTAIAQTTSDTPPLRRRLSQTCHAFIQIGHPSAFYLLFFIFIFKPVIPTGTVEGAKKIAQTGVYPLMSDEQLFLFVPPAYGAGSHDLSQTLCCAEHTRDGPNPDCGGNCTAAMIQWAIDVYDWARNDSRIAVRQNFLWHRSAQL
jgi:hypothetical protein